jgi:microcompartment protein CcmK/EutM
VAVDRAQAGVGDTVLVNAEGGGARLVFGRKLTDPLAIQDVIVGVVDAYHEG